MLEKKYQYGELQPRLIKRNEVIKAIENEQMRYINGEIKEAIQSLNPVIELDKKRLSKKYIDEIKQEYFVIETQNTLIVNLIDEN
ncbi:hypothetical protein C3495_14325 (plasmid) [Clostridiaceae bacterium 14S0207]|nr:hypothetical protein C3495_14325 [Clostridiaceae bacterium 14S0207]